MKQIECANCLYTGMPGLAFEDIGSGEDDVGEFTDYECFECGNITRAYDKDDEEMD